MPEAFPVHPSLHHRHNQADFPGYRVLYPAELHVNSIMNGTFRNHHLPLPLSPESVLCLYAFLRSRPHQSRKYNKEHLPTGSFFVAIDYGYGTGIWNSTSGGTAHIVTATGNTVYYNISADGSVTKLLESPDLYWEYI